MYTDDQIKKGILYVSSKYYSWNEKDQDFTKPFNTSYSTGYLGHPTVVKFKDGAELRLFACRDSRLQVRPTDQQIKYHKEKIAHRQGHVRGNPDKNF